VLSSESPEPYPEPPSQPPSGKRHIKDELADKYFSIEIIDSGRRGLVESSDELEIIDSPESPTHNPRTASARLPKRTFSASSLSQAAAKPTHKKQRGPRAATPYPRKKPTATMAMPVRGAEPATKLHNAHDMASKPRPHTAMRDNPTEQTRLKKPALQFIGSGNVVKSFCPRSQEARREESVNQTMGSGNVTQQPLALIANPTENAERAKQTSQPINSSTVVQSPRPRTAKLLSASIEQAQPEKPTRKPIGPIDVAQNPCLEPRRHAAVRDNPDEQTRLQKPAIQPTRFSGVTETPCPRRKEIHLEKPLAPTTKLRDDSIEQIMLEVPANQSISSSDVVQKTCLRNAVQRDAPTKRSQLRPPAHESINSSDVAEKPDPQSRAQHAQLEERANQLISSRKVTQKADARDAEQHRFRTNNFSLEEQSHLPSDSPERSPTPFIERILQDQGLAPAPSESGISPLPRGDFDHGMLVELPVDLTRLGVPGPSVVLTNGKDFFRVATVVEHLTHKDGAEKAMRIVPAWEQLIGEPANVADLERDDDDRIMVFRDGRIQWV
jgi:hypothetical protein